MKGKGRANETIRKALSYGVSWQGIPAMRMCTFLCRHTHIHLKCTWGNFLCQLQKLLIVLETLGVVLGGTLSSPCTNGICLRNLMDLKRKLSPNCFLPCFPFYIIRNLRSCFLCIVNIIIVSCKSWVYNRYGGENKNLVPPTDFALDH